MAKNKKSEHQKELENLSLPVSEVPVLEIGAHAPMFIDDYATLPKKLEDMTIKELLDMSEAAMILGKRYENLAITEGNHYFPHKSKYNDLYNKIITVLSEKLDYYL